MTLQRVHISGIDWLRATLSILVVTWHMALISRSEVFSVDNYESHEFGFSDFLNFHVLLLAVPAFMALSCFLFVRHEETPGRFRKRLVRIGILILFWPAALKLWNGSVLEAMESIPRTIPGLAVYGIRAGNTIYYFFVSLLICLTVCQLCRNLSTRAVTFLCGGFCILVAALPIVAERTQIFQLSAYWNPFNFLPYAFGSIILARRELSLNQPGIRVRAACVLAFVAAAVAMVEWHYYPDAIHFRGHGYVMPGYTRISSVGLAYLVMVLAIHPSIRPNPIVAYMSRASLALYLLHPFMMVLIRRLDDKITILETSSVLAAFSVIAMSYLSAHALRLFLRKELLS